MQNLKILNKKDVKKILTLIKEQWECDFKQDYVFLINPDNRIFVVNKEVFDINFDKLRVNSIGLYFGELNNNEIRLSIEGSQLIGPKPGKALLNLMILSLVNG